MGQLFYKKSTSILTVAAILLVLILLCTLLITLSQMVSLKSDIATLQRLVEESKSSNEAKEKLIKFLQTDDYVAKWAVENGLVKSSDLNFVERP